MVLGSATSGVAAGGRPEALRFHRRRVAPHPRRPGAGESRRRPGGGAFVVTWCPLPTPGVRRSSPAAGGRRSGGARGGDRVRGSGVDDAEAEAVRRSSAGFQDSAPGGGSGRRRRRRPPCLSAAAVQAPPAGAPRRPCRIPAAPGRPRGVGGGFRSGRRTGEGARSRAMSALYCRVSQPISQKRKSRLKNFSLHQWNSSLWVPPDPVSDALAEPPFSRRGCGRHTSSPPPPASSLSCRVRFLLSAPDPPFS